jgi:hypothetical protein
MGRAAPVGADADGPDDRRRKRESKNAAGKSSSQRFIFYIKNSCQPTDIEGFLIIAKNSLRVDGSLRNDPSIRLVTMVTPGL